MKKEAKSSANAGDQQECIIFCPLCKGEFTITQLLEACSVAWANQKWIYFSCPKCRGNSHVELRPGGKFALGYIDGGPGPCFIESDEYIAPNLKFSVRSEAITVQIDDKVFRFKTKP